MNLEASRVLRNPHELESFATGFCVYNHQLGSLILNAEILAFKNMKKKEYFFALVQIMDLLLL